MTHVVKTADGGALQKDGEVMVRLLRVRDLRGRKLCHYSEGRGE